MYTKQWFGSQSHSGNGRNSNSHQSVLTKCRAFHSNRFHTMCWMMNIYCCININIGCNSLTLTVSVLFSVCPVHLTPSSRPHNATQHINFDRFIRWLITNWNHQQMCKFFSLSSLTCWYIHKIAFYSDLLFCLSANRDITNFLPLWHRELVNQLAENCMSLAFSRCVLCCHDCGDVEKTRCGAETFHFFFISSSTQMIFQFNSILFVKQYCLQRVVHGEGGENQQLICLNTITVTHPFSAHAKEWVRLVQK